MIYSMADRTSSGTAATAAAEVRTTSSDMANVMEFGLSNNAATASVFGLGRPAAIGITPTAAKTVLAEDPGKPAGTVTTAVAWGTGPTVPANFFRRVSLIAQIGAGIVWTFPRGLQIAVSSSLVLWVIATASVVDFWVVIDE